MKLPIIDSLPPRRRKQARWALGLLLAYAIIGFLILPPIVKAVALNVLHKQLHREVSIQAVRINPFVLSTTIRGMKIMDPDGAVFVSWDEVYVNFQLSSFLGHPWVFKEISTINPYIRVQVNKDYTLNFSDLIAEAATNAPSKEPSKPIALNVDRFHIGGAIASLTDLTTRTPFRRQVGPIDVTLTHFETKPSNKNPYSFSGTTDAGEQFSWGGYFSLSPIRSAGELSLENLTLNKYAPLYQDFARFIIRDGVVDAHTEYWMELSASNLTAVATNSSFSLHSFKLAEPGSDTNFIELPEFSVSGASADASARRAEVDSVRASGGWISLKRNQDNAINVVEMAKPAEGATNAPGGILFLLQSVTNVVAMFLNSTNAWSGSVDDVEFTNCALSLEDLANARPARLNLDEINLSANHISNIPGTNLTAALSLRWNTNGTIKAEVQASFAPPTVDVQLALDKLDLHPVDPYLESKVDVLILGSKLGMNGHIQLRTPPGELPQVTFQGDTWLDDFNTVDGVLDEPLLKWSTVRLSGIDANLNPPSVAIRQIDVNDVYARVVIETNHVINLLAALHMGNTNEESAVTNAPVATAAAEKPAAKKTLSENLTISNTNLMSGLPKITIGSIVISNAEAHYTDRSLSPNVNLAVEKAGGTISGLSSEELQHAEVNLHAVVDNVGPVDITGTINPFSQQSTNELKITARDIELTPTSPYGGKYAGYRIARGKLNLDLDYHLSGKNLKSENVVTLDQFTFGEKVNSPDATHLPVRLAVAILKDRDGKIVLDVPIDGSLDDPQLRIGKVVSRAIVNILEKVATSPFSLLGAVFGGAGEEISYQNFVPGSSDLLPPDKQKLDTLVKGLYARPGLNLSIEGSINPDTDREGVKRAKLEHEMKLRKWMTLRRSERATNAVDNVVLTAGERTDLAHSLYNEALRKGTLDLAKLSANTNLAAVAAYLNAQPAEKDKGASIMEQGVEALPQAQQGPVKDTGAPTLPVITDPEELALLTTFTVSDSDLQALAADRAKAVRDYLVQVGKVQPERLFLTESQPDGVRQDGARVYLNFQ